MSRLVSKNLFNLQPLGKMDDGTIEFEAKNEEMKKSSPEIKRMADRMKELELKNDPDSNEEFVTIYRAFLKMASADLNTFGDEMVKLASEQTTTTTIKVPTTHDGEHDVVVEMYIPKALESETNSVAYIFAHGGSGVGQSMEEYRTPLQLTAMFWNFVVFNVDYRLAPETKCPNNIKDFYEVIKYVSTNAESLRIDPAKVVMTGVSGGGYICLGAMVLLAERSESGLVKLAIPVVPMVDDYSFSDPLVMTIEERKYHLTDRKVWKDLIAADYEEQKTSPYLFPGKASEDLMELFPPTIILSTEFDRFSTETTRLASRLRRAGTLLEFIVIPGATHTSAWVPGSKANEIVREVFKTIVEEYMKA